MVEDTPNRNNHQGIIECFKNKVGKLVFGLMITLILLYIFAEHLAVKSLIFLKGLSELTILPLLLLLAVLSGLFSEKISIIITILISCILTYHFTPRLMKPLFGNFERLWGIKIIVVALTCVYFYFIGLIMVTSAFYYVLFPFIAFVMLSSIPIGKMLLDKLDKAQEMGPVLTVYTFIADVREKDKEELIREYRGELDDPWVKRKITRYALVFLSGLIFSVVCFLLGFLFAVFLQFNILLAMLLIVWLLNDLYYLMRNKSLFKLEELKNVFVGRHNPEKWMILSLLPFKRYTFFKQIGGLLCILMGILWAICFCIVGFGYFIELINPIMQAEYKDIMAFLGLFSDFAYMVSLFLAIIFQLNFWYIMIKRFPHFMEICGEKDFSMDVDAPKLPTGGFPIFLVNAVIMVFLLTFYFLVYWISHYLIVSADALMWRMLIFFIPILLLCFEIYITYSTFKNRRLRETDPNNLYKDNKRIPLAVQIQFFSLVLYLVVSYASLQLYSALLSVFDLIFLLFVLNCFVISFFYLGGILDVHLKEYLYIREQDSGGYVKPITKGWIYVFILAFMAFMLFYSMDYYSGTKNNNNIYYGIVPIILAAMGFVLTTIIVRIYNKTKADAKKKPPEK